MLINNFYYLIKPLIPRRIQIAVRRRMVQRKRLLCRDVWPIDKKAGGPPKGFSGWPGQKRFALVLAHDVETTKGQEKCYDLIKLEEELGFRSSFNFVPERYGVSRELRRHLSDKGFEVGVHGLCHDGKLYKSRKIFQRRAVKINHYIKEWKAVGFCSPSMHYNLEWIHDLNIEYDSSTFDTDPFEPQSVGLGTIFPFRVTKHSPKKEYIELPYTLPQDHTLFILMREKNIDIWKKKLDWVVENGGMALLSTHPDYMNFNGKKLDIGEYPVQYYKDILEYVKSKYEGQYWHVLPKEIGRYWKNNCDSDRNNDRRINGITVGRNIRPDVIYNKKIWIDLDNSPHVVLFRPLIKELKKRGYKVVLTARNCFQVCDLANNFNMQYKRIGSHYGKNKLLKVLGMILRSIMLIPFALKEKPTIALSHGSRSQLFLAKILNITSVVMMDYEHISGLVEIRPTWSIVPEVMPDNVFKNNKSNFLKYKGIKEDIYVPDFIPEVNIKRELGIDDKNFIVTIRPPATEAHYHNPESEILLEAAINLLSEIPDIRMVLLPRDDKQKESIIKTWPDLYAAGKIIIPNHVIDGLNIIWHSEFVISGGGTMNREATALGVPVYSIFRGKIGAVDQYLADTGRLVLLESIEDVRSKIIVARWKRPAKPDQSKTNSLQILTEKLESILDSI